VHLCFLIPGGAVAVMPAAVAGATVLANHVASPTPPDAESAISASAARSVRIPTGRVRRGPTARRAE
jgi:CysZ protein